MTVPDRLLPSQLLGDFLERKEPLRSDVSACSGYRFSAFESSDPKRSGGIITIGFAGATGDNKSSNNMTTLTITVANARRCQSS